MNNCNNGVKNIVFKFREGLEVSYTKEKIT